MNVAKTAAFDPDGDQAYGSDGYYCTYRASGTGASTAIKALPSYITSVAYNTASIYAVTSYSALDNPQLALSSDVANMGATGSFYYNTASGYMQMFTIVLATNADFLLSAIVDVQSGYSPTKIKVVGPGNESEVTGLTANLIADFAFFRITGGAGDTFVVWMEATVRPGSAGLGFEAFLPAAYPALDQNHGETWRSMNIKKPAVFDPDGDNAYGSDGYYCTFRTDNVSGASPLFSSLPSYIASVSKEPSPLLVIASTGYSVLDCPTNALSADVANMRPTGMFYYNSAGYQKFFTVTLAKRSDFLLSVLVDVSTSYTPDKIKVVGPGSTVSEITGLTENLVPDVAFFRITGNAGDAFVVWMYDAVRPGTAGLGFEAIPPPVGTAVILR